MGSGIRHRAIFIFFLLLALPCTPTTSKVRDPRTWDNKLTNDKRSQYGHRDVTGTHKLCLTCHCYNDKKNYKIDCNRKKMTSIPSGISGNVTSLMFAHNAITNVTEGSFRNLNSLKVLDLAYNKIEFLHRDAFFNLVNLTSLNLTGNRISYSNANIPDSVFTHTSNLQELKFQQNLSIVHSEERYPSISNSVQFLYIDGLAQLGRDFRTIVKLKWLVFNGKVGRCNIGKVIVNMFENISSIELLTLKQCRLQSVERGSFSELPLLKSLDLSHNEVLTFAALSNISYGLQLIKTFESLNINKIHKTYGDCTKIRTTDLQYLYNTTVQQVFMESNRLSTLETEAVNFVPKSLRVLSLRDNQLILDTYVLQLFVNVLLWQKNTLADLRMLVIADQASSHNLGDLFKDLFPLPKGQQLQNQKPQLKTETRPTITPINETRLHISRTSNSPSLIPIFQNNMVFPRKTNHTLKTVDGRRNKAFDGSSTDLFMSVLNAYATLLPHCYIKTPLPCAPLPRNLFYVDMSSYIVSTEIRSFCVCEPNNLKTLLASRNLFFKWSGPVHGFSNLTKLDLSYNWCFEMSPKLFHTFPSLKELYLSHNFLSFSLNVDFSGEIFGFLSKLEILSLADNKIHQLPPAVFKGLKQLRELDLHDNQITSVNWDMTHMTNLEHLDLSQNFIMELSPTAREFLNSVGRIHNMSIELEDNELKCSCRYLETIRWISETPIKFDNNELLTCKMDNNSIRNLTHAAIINKELSRACASYTNLIVGTSLAIAVSVIVIIAAIVRRYRWNLRYMYYSAKFRLKGYNSISDGSQEFDFDVFISYAHEDSNFVKQSLVAELEGKQCFRLQVHDRDFRAGNFVADNIMQAVTTSRKTLVIMSPSFLKSSWCMYELNMARMEGIKTGREALCVLMKEHVPTLGLAPETLDIICQQTYLEYPNEAPEQLGQFWSRLGEALKA